MITYEFGIKQHDATVRIKNCRSEQHAIRKFNRVFPLHKYTYIQSGQYLNTEHIRSTSDIVPTNPPNNKPPTSVSPLPRGGPVKHE